MNAAHILSKKGGDVFTISADATLLDATKVLAHHKVGAIVVCEEAAHPIGVFSERDLVRVLSQHGSAGLSQTVATVMTRDLITVAATASIDEMMQLMTEKRVRHLLIMEDSVLEGVVSIGDVVKDKIASAEAEAESLKDYIAG